MLVRRREHTSRLDNLQFAWLMGGIGLAVITNQMRYWGLIGDGQPNPTPIGMFIGGVMVWWGLRLHPISDVARIAHDVIFRSMNEAVIVLNQDDQIVDYNTAAAKHFPLVESAIGHKLDDLPTLGQALRTLEAERGEIQPQITPSSITPSTSPTSATRCATFNWVRSTRWLTSQNASAPSGNVSTCWSPLTPTLVPSPTTSRISLVSLVVT